MNFKTLIGLWLLLLCGLVHGEDHITARAWVEDPSGQMTLEQVKKEAVLPFSGALSRGYGTGAIWLRLSIDPAARPDARRNPQELVLRMRPVYLDEVEVFDPLAPGGRVGVLGDRHHPRQEALQGADFLQPIIRGDAPRDIWLRLTSSSTRQIHVTALNTDDLARSVLRQYMVFSTYVGLVLVLVVWGLTGWVLQRDSLMGAFALKQFAALLFALSSLGFLRLFWPVGASAGLLDQLGNVFSMLTVAASLGFHLRFLHEYRPATWAMGLLLGLLAVWGGALAMLGLGWVRPALQVNMLLILLGPFAGLACALSARAWRLAGDEQPPPLPRQAVIGFYSVILLMMVAASLTALSWAPATEWSIYIAQAHGLVTALLLMALLRYRSMLLNRQRQQALLALERTGLQAQHERELREEQEKLMAMLAHEIRAPLSTMDRRLDTRLESHLEIKQAMRDMNAVIDRCIQASRISDNRLEARMEPIELTDIVHDAVASCSQPARVNLQAPARLPITTDRQLLFVVLNNLLENACKYGAPDAPIELAVNTVNDPGRGACARLELRNQVGPAGWPDPGRVFEKYYRAPYAQRRTGTGLGLYLVLHITALLGGRVQYRPQAPWLRFEVLLPLAPSWAADLPRAA